MARGRKKAEVQLQPEAKEPFTEEPETFRQAARTADRTADASAREMTEELPGREEDGLSEDAPEMTTDWVQEENKMAEEKKEAKAEAPVEKSREELKAKLREELKAELREELKEELKKELLGAVREWPSGQNRERGVMTVGGLETHGGADTEGRVGTGKEARRFDGAADNLPIYLL